MAESNTRTSIIVALIGLVGVLSTAILANLDKFSSKGTGARPNRDDDRTSLRAPSDTPNTKPDKPTAAIPPTVGSPQEKPSSFPMPKPPGKSSATPLPDGGAASALTAEENTLSAQHTTRLPKVYFSGPPAGFELANDDITEAMTQRFRELGLRSSSIIYVRAGWKPAESGAFAAVDARGMYCVQAEDAQAECKPDRLIVVTDEHQSSKQSENITKAIWRIVYGIIDSQRTLTGE